MQKKALIISLTFILSVLTSCGEYQKLLKSHDPDLKYEKAIEYFNDGKYVKAQMLLDDVAPYFKGTELSEQVLIYLARCYMGEKDYASAAEYYQSYIRSYPKGEHHIEARFMLAHAYYMDSPDARLDQAQTRQAIEAYQRFIDMFPESPYINQAYDEMEEMNNKLAYKELISARLYYNLGNYLGNNYLSCETVAKNAMRKFPTCPYLEEFAYLIVAAKYQQAIQSIESLQKERVQEATDECYSFLTEYPDSKHVKEVENYQKQLKKLIKE